MSWTPSDPTDVWVRNPRHCIREVAEVGVTKITYWRPMLNRYRTDIPAYMDMYFPGLPWELIIMSETEGVHYVRGQDTPVGVYPVFWWNRDTLEDVQKWVENPVGENKKLYDNEDIDIQYRPVKGQDHRIMFGGIHAPKSYPLISDLSEMQEENPEVNFFFSSSDRFRIIFGYPFKEVDFDPRMVASKGNIQLPNGREIHIDHSTSYIEWIRLLGYRPKDLEVARNRCMFNLRAALWAGTNFRSNVKFKTKGFAHIDPDSPHVGRERVQVDQRIRMKNKPIDKSAPGYHLYCNACPVQMDCKFYREGSVCSVPDTPGSELAQMVGSRDSDKIIDALGKLLNMQSERLQKAREVEEETETLNPETTKIINTLFDKGVVLAKLLDPKLGANDPSPIPVGSTTTNYLTMIQGANQADVAAKVIHELEKRGVARKDISPDLIQTLMTLDTEEAEKKITELIAENTSAITSGL